MLDYAIPFILALLPIIWLVVALCALRMQAWLASFTSLAVCVVVALAFFGMTPIGAATAALEGFLFALWPISIVIIAAVFTYNITVHTGAMDVIKRMLTSVSADKRVLTLLIGWCFCCFLEGMAGFGTSVAIPASILVGLGINPIAAIVACLIANGTPTMFGSIGIPTTTLATITGLDPIALGTVQTLQVAVFVVACPFLMVMLVGGGPRALKGMIREHRGCVINISSMWGVVGASCEAVYSATKGGLNAFTKALAKELAPSGIRVNALTLGVIDTDMNKCFTGEERETLMDEIPMGRMARPSEVADLVHNILTSPIYLTGAIIDFDGGWI